MRYKKFLCLLLLGILIFSNSYVEAQEKNSDNIVQKAKEEDVLWIKKLFNISDEYDEFSFHTSISYENEAEQSGKKRETKVYEWNSDHVYTTVLTDSKREILRYEKYYEDKEKGNTKEAIQNAKSVQKTAEDFLNKIDKKLIKEYIFIDANVEISSGYAGVLYQRKLNGYIVEQDTIYLDIDLYNNEVTGYSKNGILKENIKDFPIPKNIMPKEKALEKYVKNNIELAYMLIDDNAKEATPIYTHIKDLNSIDSVTGKEIKFSEARHYDKAAGMGMKEEAKDEATEPELTEIESKEIDKLKGIKNKDEALKYVNKNFPTKGLKLENVSLYKAFTGKGKKDDYAYGFSFVNKDYTKNLSINLSASDFTLYEYHYYDGDHIKKVKKLSEKQLESRAKEIVKKYYSNKNIDLEECQTYKMDDITEFYFSRVENSLRVKHQGISVGIQNDGTLINYRLEMEDVKFPEIKEKIDLNKAIEKMAEIYDFGLYYHYVDNKPQLVYGFIKSGPYMIDAKKGEKIYDGQSNGIVIKYENLDKSEYKEEIETLTEFGIGLPGAKDLTKEITHEEFTTLLSKISQDYRYNPANRKRIFEGYEEKNNESELKNKDAIRWIINNRGIDRLKDAKNVFNEKEFNDFEKIEEEYIAYFFLAKSLGIYEQNSANPEKVLTLEEALHLIYKAMMV